MPRIAVTDSVSIPSPIIFEFYDLSTQKLRVALSNPLTYVREHIHECCEFSYMLAGDDRGIPSIERFMPPKEIGEKSTKNVVTGINF
jgi:hypothetical protein